VSDAQIFMRLDKKCDVEGGVVKTGPLTVELERIWHEKPKAVASAVATK
jgi:hypothetical protein